MNWAVFRTRWRGCIKKLSGGEALRLPPPDDLNCAPLTGCGTQHPLRALCGTRVLLAAAPTTPPCFRHWRRSSSLHFAHIQRNYFLFAVPKRLQAFRNCLFTRWAGVVPFSSTKTTLWFAIFALAWYNSRIKYCVYGKLGNRVEWQRKNENQRNGVLLPAVKRQNSGSRQGLAPCLAACC